MNIEVFKKYLFLVIIFLVGACHKGDPASKGDIEYDKIKGKWILDDSFSICETEYIIFEDPFNYISVEGSYIEKGDFDFELIESRINPNRNKFQIQMKSVNGEPDCEGTTNEELIGTKIEFYYEIENGKLSFFSFEESIEPFVIWTKE